MNERNALCPTIQASQMRRSVWKPLALVPLAAIALLLSIHSVPGVAQETIGQEPVAEPIPPFNTTRSTATRSSLSSVRLRPALLIPELPDILPILPEAATMRLVLNLSQRRVFVYEGSDVKASYPVAVGKPGWETPPGSYQVISMLQDPGWISPFTGEEIPPGPDNPLGDRWIGFWTDGTNYIGFHGTPNRDSVGQAASHGCVRMFNEHIRQLYEMVDMGTPVIVEN